MDLSNLNLEKNAEEGAEMVLLHPVTGEELVDDNGQKSVIRLVGADSRRFKSRVDFHMRSDSRSGKRQPTLAQLERQSADMLAHATLGWDNISWEGESLEFSVENARDLYLKCGWLRKQVDEFVSEPANFFKSA